jgi:ATP-binding cassette, subfamily B, bacterial
MFAASGRAMMARVMLIPLLRGARRRPSSATTRSADASERNHGRDLLRALGFIRPQAGPVGGIVGLTLATSALGALEPMLMKGVFDGLVDGGVAGSWTWVAALAGLALAREALGSVGNWLSWRTRLRVQYGLLEATVGRLYRLPQHVHRTEGVGAVLTRLDRGIQGFVGAITEIAYGVLPAAIYLAMAVGFMLHLDVRLTLLALAFVPLPALIAARAAPTQIGRERTLLDRWARIYGRFHEVLSGIVTVRSFAMEDRERQRFLRDVSDANRIVERGVGFDTTVGATQNTVVTAARLATLGYGAVLVGQGEITVGTLVAFLAYLGGLFGPVQGLAGIYRTLRTASVAIEQIYAILDADEQVRDAPDAVRAAPFRGDVRFEGVSFAHDGGRPVLAGFDLEVGAGETVALVGPSGAGKSTLMALLQRFHDPSAGAVRIDGVDLRSITQGSLRAQIGVVLQEPVLFNDSIRHNIAYGRPDASDAEIEAAARAAHAHGFIERLPEGYATPIGERGGALSTGERQRIAIARALLMDPPILIFDEATSALDAESEALVQEALERVAEGRTTFVIAHRLSTIRRADRIVVLRGGQIVEIGTHEALLLRDGAYAALVRMQTQGPPPRERRAVAAVRS